MWKILILILIAVGLIEAKNGKVLIGNEIADERREMERLITDILLKSSRKDYKCIAILSDNVYYNTFHSRLFYKLMWAMDVSYFTILFESHDDLLYPFADTREALQMIKKQDCQMYIILISNGIQMSRLLRYGDRYRVLDTRVSFIMLYDNRLFTKELHYIWKRIVNVIFIREYTGIKKVGGEKKIIPWFELSTVPFPSPIKGVLLPRRLDIWRQNKFRKDVDLFRDKTSDLKNQSVRVAVFQHIPAATKILMPEFKTAKSVLPVGNVGFTGIEVEILSTVSQNMNFFPELYEPENADQEFWGNKQPDGQYSGMFGEFLQSRADIGLGDFYYTPQILDIMDLTLPYSTECLTFLTPEALTDNSWKTLILPFKPLMWLCVFLATIFVATLLYYLAQFHYKMFLVLQSEENVVERMKLKPVTIPMHAVKKLDADARYVLMKQQIDPSQKQVVMPEGLNLFVEGFNSFLYTYSMILMVSLPKLPAGWSLRLLIGWYWLYTTLVVVTYRASMTAILANPAPRVTIDTLEELVDSKLSVGSWGEINREFFMTSLDPLGQEIGSKFTIINDTDTSVDQIALGKFAFYDNTNYLKQLSVKRQLRMEMAKSNSTILVPQGDRNLHIMTDCVINMPISIGMQKNSPIKPRVDKFIRRVIEAGLIKKWLDDVMQTILNSETTNEGSKALMSTNKFFGAIVVLAIGYFISTTTFIIELVYFHRIVKRHPNFDKYSRTIKHDKTQ